MSAIKKYLAQIGAKGGAKSKRKLTKSAARKMAAERWQRAKAAQADAPGPSPGSVKARERATRKSATPALRPENARFNRSEQPSVNKG